MERKIIIVAGTRPEIIRLAPIIWIFDQKKIDYVLIWSGQHYDYEMSSIFFKEFGIRDPDYILNVGGKLPGHQTAEVMIGLEKILTRLSPNGIVTAVGDTNTVLGAALATVKSKWIFCHIEAGVRSFSRLMQEEINRVAVGSIANMHFAPSTRAILNLLYEGVESWRIFFTGNPLLDLLNNFARKFSKIRDKIISELNIKEPYGIVTIHRAENVDDPSKLNRLVEALNMISKRITLIFPIHPRTRKQLENTGLIKKLSENRNIILLKPIGYIEFISLLSAATLVLTDSGGIQLEAFALNIPCITLRKSTEWIETVEFGVNLLVGDDPNLIRKAVVKVLEEGKNLFNNKSVNRNVYGDGKAGHRIANYLYKLAVNDALYKKYAYREIDYRTMGSPTFWLLDARPFSGLSIEDFHRKYSNVYITLLYDEKGEPIPPFPELLIKESWKLRLWGSQIMIKKLMKV